MKFPNKLYSYKTSVLYLLPEVLNQIKNGHSKIDDLFLVMRPKLEDPTDFLSAMDCLYALNAVNLNEDNEVIICL